MDASLLRAGIVAPPWAFRSGTVSFADLFASEWSASVSAKSPVGAVECIRNKHVVRSFQRRNRCRARHIPYIRTVLHAVYYFDKIR